MRANEAMKIEFQNQNTNSFWICRLANSVLESLEATGIILNNFVREGENKKGDSMLARLALCKINYI